MRVVSRRVLAIALAVVPVLVVSQMAAGAPRPDPHALAAAGEDLHGFADLAAISGFDPDAHPAPPARPQAASSPRAAESPESPIPGAESSPAPTTSAGPTPTPAPTTSPGPTPSASPTPTPTPTPSPGPTPTPTPPTRPVTYRLTRFPIVTLPVGSRPYDDVRSPSLTSRPLLHDAAGVPMQLIAGRLVYKPAGLAQLAVAYVGGYRRTGNPLYLQKARDIGAVFKRIGVRSGSAIYIPYSFTFAMHGNPADRIRSPWYSAMAQGLALSLFTRLYQEAGDPRDLATAGELYRSLSNIGRGKAPWVSWIDARRYLWLEEYAQPYPEHTLNGFMFAVFGLYDYYVTTRDRNALNTLRGALTTLKANVIRYRNVGGPSDYCLNHGKPQIKYHRIHVRQLRMATAITQDPYFARVARAFTRDEP